MKRANPGAALRSTVSPRWRRTAGMIVLAALSGMPGRAEGLERPRTLAFGTGWFDFMQKRDPSWEARVEYRVGGHPLRGIAVATATGDSATFLGAGIGYELRLGRGWIVTPTFAPGYYRKGNGKDLGCSLEFRSQLELGYRFRSGYGLSIAISHVSNGGLGDSNPGQESLTLAWTLPLGRRPAH